MHTSSFLTMALAAATSVLAAPTPPTLTLLYSTNLVIPPAAANIGKGPFGSRASMQITGGSFSGEKLKGKVLSGYDWGLTDAEGTFSPDAVYFLQTDDGANIMVTEKGHAPYVQVLFETGSQKYSWINKVVGIATGGPNEAGDIALDVWQVV